MEAATLGIGSVTAGLDQCYQGLEARQIFRRELNGSLGASVRAHQLPEQELFGSGTDPAL
jgi:hypothetical protein